MSKRTKFLLGIGVIATLVIGWQIAAYAVVEQSGFQDDDGNLVIDPAPALGTFDWNGFAPVTWTGTAPNRTAEASAAGWDFDGIEDAAATNTDSAFAGGTKQDDECASVTGNKAPNKDDMRRVYFSTATVDGDVFLNLAWVRIPQNTTSPSAHIAFEFNQSDVRCQPNSTTNRLVERTPGDLLVVYDFEGGATDTPVITLREWTDSGPCEVGNSTAPCWGTATDLTALGFAEAKVNTFGSVEDNIGPTAPQTLGTSEFGEAGINLTDALSLGDNACIAFGNAFAVSRSSGNSGTAQMKDLVGPKNVDIKNCGQIIIRKQTAPDPDATTEFDFSTTGGLTPATFKLKDDGVQDYGAEIQAGNYDVTEADPGPNYALTDIDCSASDTSHGSTTTPDLQGMTVDIELKAQDTIDCTFTNTLQQGALAIVKNSTKGGAVSQPGAVFSYDSSSVTDNGTGDQDPDVGEVCVSGLNPGDYSVDETSPPPGYDDAPGTAQTVTVVTGSDCTATNYPTGSAVATFTNAPLADIQVNFRDGGSGETMLTVEPDGISCGTLTPSSTTPPTGWTDSQTFEDLAIDPSPRTITCTIQIDP